MTRASEETAFLPAVVASPEEVAALYRSITQWAPVTQALDQMTSPVLLLNEQRQIIYANHAYAEFAGGGDAASYLGQRLGASMVCVHEHKAPNGCGTGIACRNCHFGNALHTALRWESAEAEGPLRVFREKPESLELDVHLQSIALGNHRVIFCRIGDHCPGPEPETLNGAPPALTDLVSLLRAGGPFTEHFREFDEHFVEAAAPPAEQACPSEP